MSKKTIYLILTFCIVSGIAIIWFKLKPETKVDFSTEIKPILNKHCISCHGGVKKSGGFSLLFQEEAYAITESGKPAIIPGDAENSPFIQRLHEKDTELRMPYKKPQLNKEEIKLLTDWVDQGAEWGEHWAYVIPEKTEVPEIKQTAGFSADNTTPPLNEIDHFVLKELDRQNLKPNPVADSLTLIRRLSLDITGLPPGEKLLQKWKKRQLTYEALVDTLLQQKTFGEKWASWWLDLARYADSKGYEKDNGRTMWRYRDWVIESFNNDMPFDRFTIEQLAGDLLPNPSADQLIATAFNRNTMNNDEGGTEDEEFRVAAVMDRVSTTFDVWQSTTMSCVQCHSHPYDPFKHEDYYGIMGFYNNTRDEDTPGDEPVLKFFGKEELQKIDHITDWATTNGSEDIGLKYNNFLKLNEPVYQAHLATNFTNGELQDTKWLSLWDDGSCYLNNVYTQGSSYIYLNYWSPFNGTVFTIRNGGPEGEILSQFTINKTKGRIIDRFPIKKTNEQLNLYITVNNNSLQPQQGSSYIVWIGFLPDLPGKEQEGFQDIDKSFMTLLNTGAPSLPVMMDNPDYMSRANRFFERGNWMLKGDTIEPYTPAVLNAWKQEWPKNRLGLAKWIVNKENPLTARTLVNRVWHQLFGRGLVSTLEDIGTQSEFPSHPEMLDWLSLQLMNEHQWRVKALIKNIVMSRTYRQSSKSNAALFNKDPENKYYARGPRYRLSAEQIRDEALAVSGLLSHKMGGPSVMPPQPDGIWQTVYSGETWAESKGEDKYRRGIYTYLKRTSPYPSFISFDAGSREVCTIRRTITNTPLQALVTLNDPVYLEAAYRLAKQMTTAKDAEASIAIGYEKALYRPIPDEKLASLIQLYNDAMLEFNHNEQKIGEFISFEENPTAQLAALTVVANAIMNLDEFLTKS